MATFEELFGGTRKWRVFSEVSGEHMILTGTEPDDPAVKVTFTAGHFDISDGGCFQSPISRNTGKRGVLLQEVGADGADIAGSYATVGEKVLPRVRAAGTLVTPDSP